MGDIGEEQPEIEVMPVREPREVPADPSPARPEPAQPARPEPAPERDPEQVPA